MGKLADEPVGRAISAFEAAPVAYEWMVAAPRREGHQPPEVANVAPELLGRLDLTSAHRGDNETQNDEAWCLRPTSPLARQRAAITPASISLYVLRPKLWPASMRSRVGCATQMRWGFVHAGGFRLEVDHVYAIIRADSMAPPS